MINVMTLILIVDFSFLDGDVPRRPSYGVYISQVIRFARVCSHVDDFNTRKNDVFICLGTFTCIPVGYSMKLKL